MKCVLITFKIKSFCSIYALVKSAYSPYVSNNKIYHNSLEAYLLYCLCPSFFLISKLTKQLPTLSVEAPLLMATNLCFGHKCTCFIGLLRSYKCINYYKGKSFKKIMKHERMKILSFLIIRTTLLLRKEKYLCTKLAQNFCHSGSKSIGLISTSKSLK